jgi:hypothetical protein
MKESGLNRMCLLGCFSVLVIAGAIGAAENDTDSVAIAKPIIHYHFIGVGAAWFKNSNLNEKLGSIGVSSFNNNAFSLSFGKHEERRKSITESSLSLNFWDDKVDSNVRTSLVSGELMNVGGFNTLPGNLPIKLFPYFGVGLGINALHVRANNKTLSNLVTSIDRNSILWQGSILYDIGIGSDAVVKFKQHSGGLALGVRAGYRGNIYSSKSWWSNGTTITDVPSMQHSGGYIRLVFGGWDNNKHKKNG